MSDGSKTGQTNVRTFEEWGEFRVGRPAPAIANPGAIMALIIRFAGILSRLALVGWWRQLT